MRAVVLGHVHVKIGCSSGLLQVFTKGLCSSGCGSVHQHLVRSMMHGMPYYKGSSPRGTRLIFGVIVNLFGRLLGHTAHEIDVGRGVS